MISSSSLNCSTVLSYSALYSKSLYGHLIRLASLLSLTAVLRLITFPSKELLTLSLVQRAWISRIHQSFIASCALVFSQSFAVLVSGFPCCPGRGPEFGHFLHLSRNRSPSRLKSQVKRDGKRKENQIKLDN